MTKTARGIDYGTPMRGKRPAARRQPAECGFPSCTTVLSIYNSSSTCWMHTSRWPSRAADRS
ncbi:MAG TPA: hypothetical protein VF972_06835 [Actinomycetota bacterium]